MTSTLSKSEINRQAKSIGQEAFRVGLLSAPAQNPEFMEWLNEQIGRECIGSQLALRSEAMRWYITGWMDERLST